MEIMITSLKEKMRRKELYIIAGIAMLILLLLSSENTTLSIGGKMITSFEMMLPIFMMVINFISCALAIVLSIKTISNEYDKKTSHLIWIRGVSQIKYHGQLALANMVVSLIVQLIFFVMVGIFCIRKGECSGLFYLMPSYLIVGISTCIISLLTSVLSIKLPSFITGIISSTFMILGIFHSVILLFVESMGGVGSSILKYLLKIIPDLNHNAQMAGDLILGKSISWDSIVVGIVTLCFISCFLLILKRKEA